MAKRLGLGMRLPVATICVLAVAALSAPSTTAQQNGQCCNPHSIGLPMGSCDTCALAPITCNGVVHDQWLGGGCQAYRPLANCVPTQYAAGTGKSWICDAPVQCPLNEETGERCTLTANGNTFPVSGSTCSGTTCP